MDEAEWRTSDQPTLMLHFLAGKTSERKLRLFACACSRSIWHLLDGDAVPRLVEAAERLTDGLATRAEFFQTVNATRRPAPGTARDELYMPVLRATAPDLSALATAGLAQQVWMASDLSGDEGNRLFAGLLRDLLGNPFRPVVIKPAWRTAAVVALARGAYEERRLPAGTLDPDRLAVLADALEEAGCTDADILDHCRGPGPHSCGCHVVDAILGKS